MTENQTQDRAPRFESHALVEIKNPWNPFSTTSAVLLDLSIQGFKIEFVNPVKIKPGARLNMVIPLAPFQIQSPTRLKLKVIIKWFEEENFRTGGIFAELTEEQKYLIERVLTFIYEKQNA